jgi:hypothetical protein
LIHWTTGQVWVATIDSLIILKRYAKRFIIFEIEIYGKKNLELWMNHIGFSSYNTLTRYFVWRETGILPKNTDINDRIKILKERGIKFPPNVPEGI